MASFDDLRRFALALPRAYEDLHRGAPAFRVANRKFALYWPEGETVIMKLDRAHQTFLFEVRPDTFRPVGVGTALWSLVAIEDLEPAELEALTIEAWATVVPKSVSRPVLAARQSP